MLQDAPTIDHHLDEVRRLYAHKDGLIQHLDQQVAQAEGNLEMQGFFRGELAFHQGRYKAALKHYLQAKELAFTHFFCHRACAYLCHEQGQANKALAFANKAQKQRQNDPALDELYPKIESAIETSDEESTPYSEDDLAIVSLQSEEFDEIHQLFEESSEDLQPESHEEAIAATTDTPSMRNDVPSTQKLATRIEAHQANQEQAVGAYIEQMAAKHIERDEHLLVLHGWHHPSRTVQATQTLQQELWNSDAQTTSGGYFLRWQGQGLAINPGKRFLETLHRQGAHIRDIDHVLVTRKDHAAHADVEAIHSLNARVNAVNGDVHVIHYHLNQSAYQTLAPKLKPSYKQERHTVHCLELYLDSPEAEELTLSDHITLNYFPVVSHHSVEASGRNIEALGVRLDLSHDAHAVRLGYSSGAPWSPILADNLSGTQLLIAAFEGTSAEDYEKTRYNYDSLGFFGTLSLVEELKPVLVLVSEFAGAQGDLRLEVVEKLRQELNPSIEGALSQAILPADIGLEVSLKDLHVQCSSSNSFTDASELIVARTRPHLGPLLYLSRSCLV